MTVIGSYVMDLQEVGEGQAALVGGKGARLGELARIDGVRVPPGFCVTTEAFLRIMAQVPSIGELLDRLARLDPDDRETTRTLSSQIRRAVEGAVVPDEIAEPILRAHALLGADTACSVRSSATAEDLPTDSFAGQHDTYLNVVGPVAVLHQVRRCWASLFTDRAITYRLHRRIDHRQVRMAVVLQQMAFPQAAGVLFTADPVMSDRTVARVEACFGLGEALVAGLVEADVFRVRGDQFVARTIAVKQRAVQPSPAGGTHLLPIPSARQAQPALTDSQVARLVALGRRIEARFGHPQDVEWCLVDDDFRIVQSRPITTLFPVPATADEGYHVYVSVGHGQMMTDPMKPLGLSVFQLTAARPMVEAAGRLFVDVTPMLTSPENRSGLVEVMGRSDPLLGDALRTLLDRGIFPPALPDADPAAPPVDDADVPAVGTTVRTAGTTAPIETDPAVVVELIRRTEASVAELARNIRTRSGPALLDFILADIQELRRLLFDPRSHQVLMAGMEAVWWLDDHLHAWLGEKGAAGPLIRSVPHDVTSEMGLALLDVADAVRPYPDVVAFLHGVSHAGGAPGDFLDELAKRPGGREARETVETWLARYGMRGAGEIDLTRPRWRERPDLLVPVILGNVRNFAPGEARRRVEQGQQEARAKEREVLERLRALPDGREKAEETTSMIDRARAFIGYREYPKYGMVSRYALYQQALLAEAERLTRAGVLHSREDVFHLTFQELQDVVRTQQVDGELLRRRRDAFRSYRTLTPPRVLTSDGECLTGEYRREDVPAGALIGLSVSAGTVEGRARVVLDPARATLEPGDILVTPHTDPSWTPLFVTVSGLVTEVGGAMTHGALIAREYGLPAVVGVLDATRLIPDGQRIRLHGTDGYVEFLAD